MRIPLLSTLGVILTALLLFSCDSPISTETAEQLTEPSAGKSSRSTAVVRDRTPDRNVVGTSTVNRHGNSVSMTLHTSEIDPGTAITVWWVFFNFPGYCATTPCTAADLFNPDVQADVTAATGNIVGNKGTINLAAQRSVGDLDGSAWPFLNPFFESNVPIVGLLNPMGAEIHLVVRSHEEMLPAFMPDMIQTFHGGCIYPPEVPEGVTGAAGPNTCMDIQSATHLAP